MAKCAKCGGTYFPQSMSSPAEDCECGGNWTVAELRHEHREEEADRLRDELLTEDDFNA